MDALVPGISFDLNLGALFSPLLVVVLLWALNRARDVITKQNDRMHKENSERLERIEGQTTATNGKVAAHDIAIVALQAKTELLTEIYLGRQPDKGA